MCAICGIIRFDRTPVDAGALRRMRDLMVNRGPDCAGERVSGHVGLGFRRLRIIDLSENGNQPMPNEDETLWCVFNGEIYNFRELRRELEERGHVFRSKTDSETIIHGYEEWGERVVEKLDGMFALGVWSDVRQELFLARDRFGKKPLFYRRDAGGIAFASDIKAIWSLEPSGLEVNPRGVDHYLHHLSPTQEVCIFDGVEKAPPGSWLKLSESGVEVRRYWKPPFAPKRKFREEEAVDAIEETLRRAVRKRLVSDVPLGAFLSGGIDSSLVVALMSQEMGGGCKTFSIGFEHQEFSEAEYARAVAERYQTDHHERVLEPEVLKSLPSLVWEYGEPFADSSALPTGYVSQVSREKVTVALTGDGGDEMFGGYDIARVSRYSAMARKFLPRGLRRSLETMLLPEDRLPTDGGLMQKLRTLLVHGSDDPAIRHLYTQAWTPPDKRLLYTPGFVKSLGGQMAHQIYESWTDEIKGLDLIDQNLFLTIVGRLRNDYLIKIDVASMKHSLELRSPFLDAEVAALAGSIESGLKVRGGVQKYLLKRLAERHLPHDLIYRPKRGFSLPLKHWLRNEFTSAVNEYVLEGNVAAKGWFDRGRIQAVVQEHRDGVRDHTHRIWSLLWLEIWDRLFVERTLQPTDTL
jgi:asparagine synthase (glutamine-hydrolysing)